MKTEILVKVEKPYRVLIGHGVSASLPEEIPDSVEQVALLHAPALKEVATEIAGRLQQSVTLVELPDAEQAKTAETLAYCWDVLGDAGFTRSDLVISLGGGATTDLAGFVAATWLRGIKIIHIPTSLLAMVDAAVGGKTGINTKHGKNLVGSFYHPHAVFCDFNFLSTLPLSDLKQGLAEIVKCGFIADSKILDLLLTIDVQNVDLKNPVLHEVASRAIAVKADVVAADFTESQVGGLGREILNYGHTLGHAIEKVENYSIRHGEAISVGMLFVAELAGLAGALNQAAVDKHWQLIKHLELPHSYDSAKWPDLLAAMAIDKKARGNQMRFVILSEMQVPQILAAPNPELLKSAFEKVVSG